MLSINLKGKKAFVAGIGDDQGYGWAIAKTLFEAGAEILKLCVAVGGCLTVDPGCDTGSDSGCDTGGNVSGTLRGSTPVTLLGGNVYSC